LNHDERCPVALMAYELDVGRDTSEKKIIKDIEMRKDEFLFTIGLGPGGIPPGIFLIP
jgi:hypothetical protein